MNAVIMKFALGFILIFGAFVQVGTASAQPSQAIPGNYTCGVLLNILQAGTAWQRQLLLHDIENQTENMRDLESTFGLSHNAPAQRKKAETEVLSMLPFACTHGFGPNAPLSLLIAQSYLGSLAYQHGINFPPRNFGDVMVSWLNQVPAYGQ